MLAEEPAAERRRRLRDVVAGQVGAAVVAGVVARSGSRSRRPGSASPSAPSRRRSRRPSRSRRSRSAARGRPRRCCATAAVDLVRRSAGRGSAAATARRTPTGTGKSGQNIRDSMSARYGSSACSSWTSRSASVTPFSPIVTTSGWRPLRRMPLSRSLPKIIGLPCSRTSIRSSRTSRSVKSRHAPSLKMLQFWRTSTNVEPLWRPARSSVFWRCSVWVSTRAGDERRLGGEGDRQRLIGVSTVPIGVDFVLLPNSDVGLAWPLVRP